MKRAFRVTIKKAVWWVQIHKLFKLFGWTVAFIKASRISDERDA